MARPLFQPQLWASTAMLNRHDAEDHPRLKFLNESLHLGAKEIHAVEGLCNGVFAGAPDAADFNDPHIVEAFGRPFSTDTTAEGNEQVGHHEDHLLFIKMLNVDGVPHDCGVHKVAHLWRGIRPRVVKQLMRLSTQSAAFAEEPC